MKKSALYDMDESIGYLLNRTAVAVRLTLEARLAPFDITAPQWSVLVRLWAEDGLSSSELCRRLFFDRPTMTGIIDRMEAKQLLKRVRDPNDRRATNVYLTDYGKSLQQELSKLAQEAQRKSMRGFTSEETMLLKNMLNRILNNSL